MIARNDTGIKTGVGPGGLHGYDSLRYPVPTPAQFLRGTDQITRFRLGDISSQDIGLIETLTSDAQQAFESTQPSAVAAATFGGGGGPIPPGVNQGTISFGGSTGILVLVGLGLVAWAFSGRKRVF